MEIEEKLVDKFYETVDVFMDFAKAKESELSIPQISSSYLYTSACYSGRYFAIKAEKEEVNLEEFIKEHVEFFEESIRAAIKYYTGDASGITITIDLADLYAQKDRV